MGIEVRVVDPGIKEAVEHLAQIAPLLRRQPVADLGQRDGAVDAPCQQSGLIEQAGALAAGQQWLGNRQTLTMQALEHCKLGQRTTAPVAEKQIAVSDQARNQTATPKAPQNRRAG